MFQTKKADNFLELEELWGMRTIRLNNGVEIPQEGFGVFQMTDLKVCEQAVLNALHLGYRLLDTASSYKNEEAVGLAVKKSGVSRQDLFITSKAYIQEMGYENTKEAFENSCKKLGTDYLDLYLIHMSFNDYYGSWKAMEELYKEGRIRAIGISNFLPDRIVDFCMNVNIIPAVNQMEIHPFYQRQEDIKIMGEYGIQAEAWKDNGTGYPALEYTKEHGYHSKICDMGRMKENLDIWDFELSEDEMLQIASLDLGRPLMFDPTDIGEVRRVYHYLENPVVTSL